MRVNWDTAQAAHCEAASAGRQRGEGVVWHNACVQTQTYVRAPRELTTAGCARMAVVVCAAPPITIVVLACEVAALA